MITAMTNSTAEVPLLHDVKERFRSEEMRLKKMLETADNC